jgi:hypothetical protein
MRERRERGWDVETDIQIEKETKGGRFVESEMDKRTDRHKNRWTK